MTFIEKIEESIALLSKSILSSDLIIDSEELDWILKIQKPIEDIYRLLNFSLISGEYIILKNIELKLNRYSDLIDDFFNNNNISSDRLKFIVVEIFKILKKDFEAYKFYYHLFINSIQNPAFSYLGYESFQDPEIDIQGDESILKKTQDLSEVFSLSIEVSWLDCELMINREYLRSVHNISRELLKRRDLLNEDYVNVLIDHCNILMYKLSLKYNDQLDNLYIYQSGDKPFSLEDKFYNLKFSWPLIQKCRDIYTEATYKKTINKYFRDFVIRGKNKTYFQTFIACHYFKNISKSRESIEALIAEFEASSKKLSSLYDKYCYNTSINYLYNCRLSFIIEEQSLTITQIKKEYDKIIKVQSNTNIHNYFPFLKIAKWCINQLKSDTLSKNNYNNINFTLSLTRDCLNQGRSRIKKSKGNAGCFIPFRTNYTESLNQITLSDGNSLRVFIMTSFIVPLDYDKIFDELEALEHEYFILKSSFSAREAINALVDKLSTDNDVISRDIKTTIESVTLSNKQIKEVTRKEIEASEKKTQDSLKEYQKENLQILSIFAAIVIFASSSVQIYKIGATLEEGLKFMMFFAASLGTLSLTIWLIHLRRSQNATTNTRIVWGVMASIFLIHCFNLDWRPKPILDNASTNQILFDNEYRTLNRTISNPRNVILIDDSLNNKREIKRDVFPK